VANFTPEEYERRMADRLVPKVKTTVPQFIVYAVKCKDKTVYIGSGAIGREKHCQSGCSHVYSLNKLHFSGEFMETTIIKRFDTREDAMQAEKVLIMQIRPEFNKMNNPDAPRMVNSAVKKEWEAYFDTFPDAKCRLYKKLFWYLLDSFGVNNLISPKGVALAGISRRNMSNIFYKFIKSKEGSPLYEKYRVLHELFMSEPGYIKVPKAPPKINKDIK